MDNHNRHLICLQLGKQIFLLLAKNIAGKYQKGQINLIHKFEALLHPLLPYLSYIIHSGSINQLYRSHIRYLHPFLHRICSCSCLVTHNCKILPKQQIYEGTLSHIPSSKNSYMFNAHNLIPLIVCSAQLLLQLIDDPVPHGSGVLRVQPVAGIL